MPISTQPTRDFKRVADAQPANWCVADHPLDYVATVEAMEARAAAIAEGTAPESIWLIEHPPIYTAGTSARAEDLRAPRFPVFSTGRGGQYTYHGPGQRIAYVMLDLRRRRQDVRAFVEALEQWIVATLGSLNVAAGTRPGRIGVWVLRPDKPPGLDGSMAEDKIAAIGIRLRRWVSFHGLSINVEPDLSHFEGIVPCGIADRHFGVTSLVDLGHPIAMSDLDEALRQAFVPIFGPIAPAQVLS